MAARPEGQEIMKMTIARCPWCQGNPVTQPDMAECRDEVDFDERQSWADERVAAHICQEMVEAGF